MCFGAVIIGGITRSVNELVFVGAECWVLGVVLNAEVLRSVLVSGIRSVSQHQASVLCLSTGS
jgi:hypothetical protein